MRETDSKGRLGQAIVHDSVLIAEGIQAKHSDHLQQDCDNLNPRKYYIDTVDVRLDDLGPY